MPRLTPTIQIRTYLSARLQMTAQGPYYLRQQILIGRYTSPVNYLGPQSDTLERKSLYENDRGSGKKINNATTVLIKLAEKYYIKCNCLLGFCRKRPRFLRRNYYAAILSSASVSVFALIGGSDERSSRPRLTFLF